MIRTGSHWRYYHTSARQQKKDKHSKEPGRSVRTDAHCDAMTLKAHPGLSDRSITSNKTLPHLPQKMALAPTQGHRHRYTRPQRVKFKNRREGAPGLKSWGGGGSVGGERNGRVSMWLTRSTTSAASTKPTKCNSSPPESVSYPPVRPCTHAHGTGDARSPGQRNTARRVLSKYRISSPQRQNSTTATKISSAQATTATHLKPEKRRPSGRPTIRGAKTQGACGSTTHRRPRNKRHPIADTDSWQHADNCLAKESVHVPRQALHGHHQGEDKPSLHPPAHNTNRAPGD